ncbi:N-6 DNA methylase [Algoriphagus aestuarii]|nr:N-6 DNA methylase [Algoriphagus aestuarii]
MRTQILDFTEENGLVICGRPEMALNNYENLYLFEIEKLKAHSVFFRRFFKAKEDPNPFKSEPVVCVFKREKVPLNSPKHLEIHSALWSEGKIDVYIIFDETGIDIYNARKPAVKTSENELSLDSLKLPADLMFLLENEMSASHLFGTGTFWEQSEFQNQINLGKSPYRHLIDYLMKVRKRFIENEKKLGPETIDKILVLSILVKFLEEKKDIGTDRSTLDDIYSKYQVESLVEAVETGKFLNILKDLASEFNGKVFDQFTDLEKNQIVKTNLDLLVQFLKAEKDLDTEQLFLWKQYSFQHLPAEVISAIYENFIQEDAIREGNGREKGVVYTPIHLVNFMVDEVMPLENPPKSFLDNGVYKILDPTCGSGVFLVAAFKRLLQWWAIEESRKSGKICFPDAQMAQKILEENIFGVDVKPAAVRVSIFGLTTALLDYLTPKQVWSKLRFKDLSTKNIVVAPQPTGFFQWALDAKNQKKQFSLIIGNPPFNPEKSVSKDKVLDPTIIRSLELKHPNIPRKNFALYFFETAMLLTDKICMVIPSNVLLYDKSAHKYREELFTDYFVSDIFDFTHLRRGLFTSADTPVAVLLGYSKKSSHVPITHTVVKRTISEEQKIRFEIDDYDRHQVKWNWAVDPDKQFIWKTNLLGGGRLFHMIYRLSNIPSLGSFIEGKKKIGWEEIRGFEGGKDFTMEDCDRILSIGINGEPKIQYSTSFSTGNLKNPFMYEPPFLIIDQVYGNSNIPVLFVSSNQNFTNKQHLYYNRDFIGISAPNHEESDLLKVFNSFKSKDYDKLNYQTYTLAKSSSAMILTETDINKSEILDVPFQIDHGSINISQSEAIIQFDILNYLIHLGKQITKKSDGASLHQSVKEKQLLEYGKVLCSELNDIYEKNSNFWQVGKIFRKPSYTIFQIGYGPKGKLKQKFVEGQIDQSIQNLINNDSSNRGAAYKRTVRLYDHIDGFDCIFFVKPNAFRYWMKSIALRDADETFIDLKAEGF